MTRTAKDDDHRPGAVGSAGPEAAPFPRPLKRSGDAFKDLVELMARLRTPGSGCPWDLEQTFATIAPYTIEEAYEVADAIERNDMAELEERAGRPAVSVGLSRTEWPRSLARSRSTMSSRASSTKWSGVIPTSSTTGTVTTADGQTLAWEAMKAEERSEKTAEGPASALDGVAMALPALMRAEKLAKRAARVGFDWPSPGPVLEKLDEEIGELREALDAPERDQQHVEEELGDILFVVANLCRKLEVDPEVALRRANSKFVRRFSGMEALADGRGVEFAKLPLEQQEALWVEVKAAERAK